MLDPLFVLAIITGIPEFETDRYFVTMTAVTR
jgi:hypothetical protein